MNKAMETIEMLRKMKHLKKKDIIRLDSSRTRYYEHMDAEDIKVMTFKKYLNLMNYDLLIRDRLTGLEKKM